MAGPENNGEKVEKVTNLPTHDVSENTLLTNASLKDVSDRTPPLNDAVSASASASPEQAFASAIGNASKHIDTLKGGGQDTADILASFVTADKGTAERALQVATVMVATGKLPSDVKSWGAADFEKIAKG